MKNNLYDSDPYSWSLNQAQLLRDGKFNELDLENLIEEVEDMGGRHRDALKSALKQLLLHLLKWQMQSQKDDLHDMKIWYLSWLDSIAKQRLKIEEVLEDNPGLQNKLAEVFTKAYSLARQLAAIDMKCKVNDFPNECPWSYDQIMTRNWLP